MIPEQTLPVAYKQYRMLRNTKNIDEERERRRIKADIARSVSSGDANWYTSRLQREIPIFNRSYGEIASKLNDSAFNDKEPSLAEAVLATERLQKDYKEISELLSPHARAIIRIGSTTWAENFDVRMNHGMPSDLDLEVFLDKPSPISLPEIPSLNEALTNFQGYYEDGDADYLAFGFNRGDRPVSIHFMPTELFEDITHRDYFTNPRVHRLREYRMKPKSKPPRYEQRDAFGNLHIFEGIPHLVEKGQITETPLMLVGTENQLVMGLVMDKYLAYPKTEGDTDLFNENVSYFKKGLADHLSIYGGSFSGFPSRRDRMPYWILDQLDKEQLWLTNS